jgi:hypothetical protein
VDAVEQLNPRKILQALPFFTGRLVDLASMLESIFGHSASNDIARFVTLYTALAWGSGKTQLGLQCLKQFHLQEQLLREHGIEDEMIEEGKTMYLGHMDLRNIAGKNYGGMCDFSVFTSLALFMVPL